MRVCAAFVLLALSACAEGTDGTMAAPLMGANEMRPEPGLFTGPQGEAVIFGGDFPEADEDGALEPAGRPTGSLYRG